jgi:hypothetical protein
MKLYAETVCMNTGHSREMGTNGGGSADNLPWRFVANPITPTHIEPGINVPDEPVVKPTVYVTQS